MSRPPTYACYMSMSVLHVHVLTPYLVELSQREGGGAERTRAEKMTYCQKPKLLQILSHCVVLYCLFPPPPAVADPSPLCQLFPLAEEGEWTGGRQQQGWGGSRQNTE